MASAHGEKAVLILCLGIDPFSLDQTMDNLTICMGILNYLRVIQGRGYIMTVNFSGTRLLQATTVQMVEDSLREDHYDWASVLERAEERFFKDTPEECSHCEIVLVGTDQVPPNVRDASEVCGRLKLAGIRVNSIMAEPTPGYRRWSRASARASAMARLSRGFGWLTPSREYHGHDPEGGDRIPVHDEWNMVRFARATGGLTLEPSTDGSLALHRLFGEMFRRWGEEYWKWAGNKEIGL